MSNQITSQRQWPKNTNKLAKGVTADRYRSWAIAWQNRDHLAGGSADTASQETRAAAVGKLVEAGETVLVLGTLPSLVDELRGKGCRLVIVDEHVLAQHTVTESYSGDGLIVASFCASDRNIQPIELSRNCPTNSLFRELEFDLHDVQQQLVLTQQQLILTQQQLKAAQVRLASLERLEHLGPLSRRVAFKMHSFSRKFPLASATLKQVIRMAS